MDTRDTLDALSGARSYEVLGVSAQNVIVGLDGMAPVLDFGVGVAREDRARAIGELDAASPSIVFGATDAKGDVLDVRVVLDGEMPALVTPVRAESTTRRFPLVPALVGGAGLLALGGGLAFRLGSDAEADRLRNTCAPTCDASSRDALSDKIVASNVSPSIGAVALATTAVTGSSSRNTEVHAHDASAHSR